MLCVCSNPDNISRELNHMPTNDRPLKVFLCHARADRNTVFTLYTQLIKDGVDAWLDKKNLLPGQNWEYEISKAVKEADVVVVCLSNNFNQSGYRQKEVSLALDTAMKQTPDDIFIIPARLDECEVIDSLEKWQWVDLFEPDGYEMLMLALRARAEDVNVILPGKKGWLPVSSLPRKSDEIGHGKKPVESQHPDSKSGGPKISSATNTKWYMQKGAAAMVMIGLIFVAILISPLLEKMFASPSPTPTQTIPPVSSPGPSPMPEESPTGEPTALPTLPIPTPDAAVHGKDGMQLILIPAGEFLMGSTGNAVDERPVHKVYLDAFFIDQTEVTNAMYAECVKSGRCDEPRLNTSILQNEQNNSFYYGNPDFDNYPVIHVSWDNAIAYCEWVGRRLPTEAEWEKAASWDDEQKENRLYPWGGKVDCSYANYYGNGDKLCVGDTTSIGSYPNGASFYGVLNMAGNVWEWVVDRYDPEYYGKSDYRNPTGPNSGDYIVIRGGSFLTGRAVGIRSSDREIFPPDSTSQAIGFRCAMDATP